MQSRSFRRRHRGPSCDTQALLGHEPTASEGVKDQTTGPVPRGTAAGPGLGHPDAFPERAVLQPGAASGPQGSAAGTAWCSGVCIPLSPAYLGPGSGGDRGGAEGQGRAGWHTQSHGLRSRQWQRPEPLHATDGRPGRGWLRGRRPCSYLEALTWALSNRAGLSLPASRANTPSPRPQAAAQPARSQHPPERIGAPQGRLPFPHGSTAPSAQDLDAQAGRLLGFAGAHSWSAGVRICPG